VINFKIRSIEESLEKLIRFSTIRNKGLKQSFLNSFESITAEKPIFSGILSSILAVLMAFIIVSVIISIEGINPILAYASLFQGAFGGAYNIAETLAKAAPLTFTGLAAAIAFKCKIWNIGAEGQLYIGAIATTWVGLTFKLPPFLHIALIIIFSFLAGAIYGIIPGLLKAKFRANEILITLMMNYIAIYFVSYLVENPWRDPSGITYSPTLATSAWLPVLVPRTRLHAGVALAVVCALLLHVLIHKTTLGYKTKAVGSSLSAANYGGISVFWVITIIMAISGGLAGLAGMGEVSGIQHRLMGGLSPWYGYLGVIVALLGRLEPLGVLLAAILLGALFVGADAMQRAAGVPVTIIYILEALILVFLVGGEKAFRDYVFKRAKR
jgi:simple sugar transport system permease protein